MLKAGYGSNLGDVRAMTARETIQALHYEEFLVDYENKFVEVNKE